MVDKEKMPRRPESIRIETGRKQFYYAYGSALQ